MSELTWHTRPRVWTGPDGSERKSWEYVIELATIGGSRQRVTRGGFRTEKAMKQALQDELRARQCGTFAKPSRGSFADYLTDTWLPWIQEHRRATTHDLYTRHARLHVMPALGAMRLQDIGPLDIEALYMALAKPVPNGRGALGECSLHNVATVMHGSLTQAVRWRLIGSNPARDVKPPAVHSADSGEPACWSAAEVGAFLDHVDATCCHERVIQERRKRKNGVVYTYKRTIAPDPMLRALMYILATTGMRRGEACGLQWRDVDRGTGYLCVRRSRVDVGGRVVESPQRRAAAGAESSSTRTRWLS